MRKSRGVTIVEVLTVVAILVLLAAIVYPVVSAAKAGGYKAACASRLKQIYSAFELYASENPGYARIHPNVDIPEAPMQDIRLLLPYLKDSDMFRCPETPECAKEKLFNTYRFAALPRSEDRVFDSWRMQYNARFSDLSRGYPIVYCQVHDELHYFPSERDIAEETNPPFVIRLLPDGSVRSGRYSMPRTHDIAKACR